MPHYCFDCHVHKELQDWAKFWVYAAEKTEEEMSVLVKDNPMILEAQRELKLFSSDETNRELARSRQRFIEDAVILLSTERAEGRVEGRVEGKMERNVEIACRMISKGYDTAVIADMTGLSEGKIEQLR